VDENSYLSGALGVWSFKPTPCYNPESMNISTLLRRIPGILALLLALFPLHAQETELFVENVTAEAGGEVTVTVRARGLSSVIALQLSIGWDTLLLEYQESNDANIQGATTGFNVSNTGSGTLGYLAIDDGLMPFDLPDSTAVFSVVFQSLTSSAEVTEIRFDSIPLKLQMSDAENNDVTATYTPGEITLEGTSGIPSFAEDKRFSVAPNPFSDFVRLTTKLTYGGSAKLEILDLSGRLVGTRTLNLRSGLQTTELSSDDFPGVGSYVIRLITDREQLHRKVVLHGRNR